MFEFVLDAVYCLKFGYVVQLELHSAATGLPKTPADEVPRQFENGSLIDRSRVQGNELISHPGYSVTIRELDA